MTSNFLQANPPYQSMDPSYINNFSTNHGFNPNGPVWAVSSNASTFDTLVQAEGSTYTNQNIQDEDPGYKSDEEAGEFALSLKLTCSLKVV